MLFFFHQPGDPPLTQIIWLRIHEAAWRWNGYDEIHMNVGTPVTRR